MELEPSTPSSSSSSSSIFAGLRIGLQSPLSQAMGDTMSLIMNNGGNWCNINKTATHLVTNVINPARQDYKLAIKYGLPIVKDSWLLDSIANGRLEDVKKHLTVPSDQPLPEPAAPLKTKTKAQTKEKTGGKRKAKKEEEDEEEEEEEKKAKKKKAKTPAKKKATTTTKK